MVLSSCAALNTTAAHWQHNTSLRQAHIHEVMATLMLCTLQSSFTSHSLEGWAVVVGLAAVGLGEVAADIQSQSSCRFGLRLFPQLYHACITGCFRCLVTCGAGHRMERHAPPRFVIFAKQYICIPTNEYSQRVHLLAG